MNDNDEKKLSDIAQKIAQGKPLEKQQPYEERKSEKIAQSLNNLQQLLNSFVPHPDDYDPLDLIGQNWGNMQIRELIGQGGMGVVYLAYDTVLDRQVALKTLNGNALNYMDAKAFVSEAKHMAQVRHPHIMAVYGAGIENNISAYWGELLKGKTAEEYLQQKSSLDPQELNKLSLQLAEAVAAIHDKGLVHGDIKSNNVLIEEGRGAVLMDFGTSFDLADRDSVWFRPSTPLAMAPEQFKGEKPTQISDVFSLGVLLHLLITGAYPFAGENFEQLKENVLQGSRKPFKPLNKTHQVYGKLIDHMLCVLPEDSPNIHKVIKDLHHIKQMPMQKNRNRLFALAALVLTVITVASIYLAYSTRQNEIKTLLANKETDGVNSVLSDIIRSPSAVWFGEEVRVKDLLLHKVDSIAQNPELSARVKSRIYLAFSHSFQSFGNKQQQFDMLNAVIDLEDSPKRYVRQALLQKAKVTVHEGNYQETKNLLNQAQATQIPQQFERLLNIDAHDIWATYFFKQQLLDKAEASVLAAIELWNKGEITFDASVSYTTLGNILLTKSDFEGAKNAFQQCVNIARKFQGLRNSNVLGCQSQLASIFGELGEYEQAITLYEQLLPIAVGFLRSNSQELFGIRTNYAATLHRVGYYERALFITKQLLKATEDHPALREHGLLIKGNLAGIYSELKRYEEAEVLMVENIAELTAFYSPIHAITLRGQNNLAEIYSLTERYDQAIALINLKLPTVIAELGEQNLIALEMQYNLAWSYYQTGKITQSLELLDTIIENGTKTYGTESPTLSKTITLKQKIKQATQQ